MAILQLSICYAVESISGPSEAYCLHPLTIGVTSGSAKPAHAFLQYAFGGPDRYCPGVQRIVQQPSTNSLLLCLIRFHFCAGRNNAIIIFINFFNHSPTFTLRIQK